MFCELHTETLLVDSYTTSSSKLQCKMPLNIGVIRNRSLNALQSIRDCTDDFRLSTDSWLYDSEK